MLEFDGTSDDFADLLESKQAVLAYFSTTECKVCAALKPQISALSDTCFEKLTVVYVSLNRYPEIAGQYRIFTVPTVVVFFEGREYIRKSRTFSVSELKSELSRLYQLMFS